MTGIIVTIISCVVAIGGFVVSTAAPAGSKGLFGLTRLGVALILLSIVGGVVGVVKAVSDARDATANEQWRDSSTKTLKVIVARLNGLQASADPTLREHLAQVADQISAVATRSHASNFSMSDFSDSSFQFGNFTHADFDRSLFLGANFRGANFRDALFEGADFSGADLSSIIIDANTRLPQDRK